MRIRGYRPSDCRDTAELFYNTIHAVNARDYTEEQLDAWAPGDTDLEMWNQSLQEHFCVVAEEEGNGGIIGFGDIDRTGYLDRLFVHKDYQGKGIADAICGQLEQAAEGTVITHASITAKPYFEKRGYKTAGEQYVGRRGITLKNYVMVKER